MDGLTRHQKQVIEHQKELAIEWAVEEAIKKWIRVSGCLALIIVIGFMLFLMYGPAYMAILKFILTTILTQKSERKGTHAFMPPGILIGV